VPEGALKDQIMQLASQPGQGYMAELASNPKINWEQIKLVHDQWQYSQQGLTGAGAALLAIAVAYFTAGMGTALAGTTTTTTAATANTADQHRAAGGCPYPGG
jgi:filamentous hemagglutinin